MLTMEPNLIPSNLAKNIACGNIKLNKIGQKVPYDLLKIAKNMRPNLDFRSIRPNVDKLTMPA